MCSITVQMLSHGMRLSVLGSDSVGNSKPEGTSRQANGQPADGQDDHEDKPAWIAATGESQIV